jgi:hypothetical protein
VHAKHGRAACAREPLRAARCVFLLLLLVLLLLLLLL